MQNWLLLAKRHKRKATLGTILLICGGALYIIIKNQIRESQQEIQNSQEVMKALDLYHNRLHAFKQKVSEKFKEALHHGTIISIEYSKKKNENKLVVSDSLLTQSVYLQGSLSLKTIHTTQTPPPNNHNSPEIPSNQQSSSCNTLSHSSSPSPSLKHISMLLPPYKPGELIEETDHHYLIFNKFYVTQEHLLIVSKELRKQQSFIQARDFDKGYRVMTALNGLLVLNGGPRAASTQSQFHMQVLSEYKRYLPQDMFDKHLNDEKLLGSDQQIFQKIDLFKGYKHVYIRLRDIRLENQGSEELLINEQIDKVSARLGELIHERYMEGMRRINNIQLNQENAQNNKQKQGYGNAETDKYFSKLRYDQEPLEDYSMLMTQDYMLIVLRANQHFPGSDASFGGVNLFAGLICPSRESFDKVEKKSMKEVFDYTLIKEESLQSNFN